MNKSITVRLSLLAIKYYDFIIREFGYAVQNSIVISSAQMSAESRTGRADSSTNCI